MEYYDALKAAWNSTQLPAGVVGTALTAQMSISERLEAINGWLVAGPRVNIPVAQIIRYLSTKRKLALVLRYGANPPQTEAGSCAAELCALLSLGTAAPPFMTSHDDDHAAFCGMLKAISSDPNSGLAQGDADAIAALADRTIPWTSAPVAAGGAGLNSIVSGGDLVGAALTALVTSAPTEVGSNVLHFDAVPPWLVPGLEVHDLGLDQTDIPEATTVESVTATSVTMTNAVVAGSRPNDFDNETNDKNGIAAGDLIGFH